MRKRNGQFLPTFPKKPSSRLGPKSRGFKSFCLGGWSTICVHPQVQKLDLVEPFHTHRETHTPLPSMDSIYYLTAGVMRIINSEKMSKYASVQFFRQIVFFFFLSQITNGDWKKFWLANKKEKCRIGWYFLLQAGGWVSFQKDWSNDRFQNSYFSEKLIFF